MNERQNKILKILSKTGTKTVNELVDLLNVSGVTIRQDLNLLEEEGFVKRVHGGVVLKNTDDISRRLTINYEQKLKIAREAANFVETGDTILIELGSTNAILAKELTKPENLTVITLNVVIAREFRKNEKSNVILLGGNYQKESETLIGPIAKICLSHVNFKKAFIGVDGYSIEAGFTSKDMMRAEISSEIVKRAETVFILTDSSKFGRRELVKLFDIDNVDYVITDSGIPEKERDYLIKKGIKLVIC